MLPLDKDLSARSVLGRGFHEALGGDRSETEKGSKQEVCAEGNEAQSRLGPRGGCAAGAVCAPLHG